MKSELSSLDSKHSEFGGRSLLKSALMYAKDIMPVCRIHEGPQNIVVSVTEFFKCL